MGPHPVSEHDGPVGLLVEAPELLRAQAGAPVERVTLQPLGVQRRGGAEERLVEQVRVEAADLQRPPMLMLFMRAAEACSCQVRVAPGGAEAKIPLPLLHTNQAEASWKRTAACSAVLGLLHGRACTVRNAPQQRIVLSPAG